MNDKEILASLQALRWEEHYPQKPYVKYYRFRVPTSKGWEYFYLDRSTSNAKLCLHPRFQDWRKEFRECPGVEIGGTNGDLILKSADMLDFPRVKGRTGNDISSFFPLRFNSNDALNRAIAVIADKAHFISVPSTQTAEANMRDRSDIPEVPHPAESASDVSSKGKPHFISEADLLDILNRQRLNGAAGERIVVDWETVRLKDCGCSAPGEFIDHTSTKNVAAGFDIHSNWTSDQERFIEVKTTASGADHFFMSQNEKRVLNDKAGKSYIYIVDLDSTGKDTGTVRTPIKYDEAAFEFEPVAYRVRLKQ